MEETPAQLVRTYIRRLNFSLTIGWAGLAMVLFQTSVSLLPIDPNVAAMFSRSVAGALFMLAIQASFSAIAVWVTLDVPAESELKLKDGFLFAFPVLASGASLVMFWRIYNNIIVEIFLF